MKYLSICSGIKSPTIARSELGWEHVAFAEVAPFPSAALAYHYRKTPNLGDFTKITKDNLNKEEKTT